MRRSRALLLTLSMVVAALFGVLLPGTATASENAAPTRTVAASDVAAADYELNYAVAGSRPPRSELACHSVSAVEICYEAYGDRWWIQDQAADSASAVVYWENFRGGSLYRSGMCVNSLGNGKWGQCNKNYYENSVLNGFPCVWDRSEDANAVCNSSGRRFQ